MHITMSKPDILLVFDKTGDSIPFEIVQNRELVEVFINKINENGNMQFTNTTLPATINTLANRLHGYLVTINKCLQELSTGMTLPVKKNTADYLDQQLMIDLHAQWALSQYIIINIDKLRYSLDPVEAAIGGKLRHCYPDEIVEVKLAEALAHLGLINEYEEINITIHYLEAMFNTENLEFNSPSKWEVFPHHVQNVVIDNSVTNLTFGYTYLGRKIYDRFINFDDTLLNTDHYNFERLEYAFNINLLRPQTIPFSPEFLSWCATHHVQPRGTNVPIANVIGLNERLFEFRKLLYKNIGNNNSASLILQ